MKVIVNFLGVPTLTINHRPVQLANKKIAGLLFYLFHEKQVVRSKIATLFWGEKNDELASGNLRNALYLIKKLIPEPIFIIDRKLIKIAPEVELVRDIDELVRLGHCSLSQVKKMAGEFLCGIIIDSDEFNDWLMFRRQEYSDLYNKNLQWRIDCRLQNQKYDDGIDCLRLLINRDNLDESSYLKLMQAYIQSGQASKAIKVYASLVKILHDELATKPCAEIEQCYRQLLNYKNNKQSALENKVVDFFARQAEINTITHHINHSKPGSNIFITLSGAPGIGKSSLVEALLPRLTQSQPLYCRAFEASKKYPYSSWNSFFRELGYEMKGSKFNNRLKLHILKTHFPSFEVDDYHWPENTNFSPLLQLQNPIQLGEILAEVVNSLTYSKRRLIILEDFQWFDQTSLEMLQSFLSTVNNILLIVLNSTGEGRNILFERLIPKHAGPICKINLQPFSFSETAALCQQVLKSPLTPRQQQQIYEQTEGIPLYVNEYLSILQDDADKEQLSARLAGIMENRLASLSDNQQRILEYLSVFTSEVLYSHFIELYNAMENDPQKKLHLLEDLDQLYRKSFIQEQIHADRQLKLQFCHERIKTYVYHQMSEFRKRAIHSRVAAILEQGAMKNVWDKALENETIYHHHKTANEPAALNFQLARLRRHVVINHELFPLIDDSELRLCGLPFSTRDMTEQHINQAEQQLNEIKCHYPMSDDLARATALFQEISGSYNIYFGNYKHGKYAVEQALKYAKGKQQLEMMMRCLLQLSFIGVQTEHVQSIMQPAKLLCEIAIDQQNELFLAIALRFLGVAQQINGRSEVAEQLFIQSRDRLISLAMAGEHYTLNLLAVENYIGELYHRRGQFSQASDYFEQCLSACHDKNLFWGRPLFHSNVAYVALSQKQYDKAEAHVDNAIHLFETTPSGRKSSIAYSIKSLLEAKKGNIQRTVDYLQAGEELCKPIQKKSWMALQLWVKGQLKQLPQFNRQDLILHQLNQSANEYQQQANELFSHIHFDQRVLGY